MVDGVMNSEAQLDPFQKVGIITTVESARECFRHIDAPRWKLFCLDLENERIKKVITLEEAIAFYES